jgi:hypothetical protein
MCRKAPLASAVSKLGYPVFPVLCLGSAAPGDRHSMQSCEYFVECTYLNQFESKARVLIFTHAYLPLPRNRNESIAPDLVVIDESFLSTCLTTIEIPRENLAAAAQGEVELQRLISTVLTALENETPLLNAIREAGFTQKSLRKLLAAHSTSGAGFFDAPDEQEGLRRLQNKAPRLRLDVLLTILADELATSRGISHGVTYDPIGRKVRLHYRKPITRFQFEGHEPTILLIDANADPELIQAWFPVITNKDIQVQRNAYVVQCSSVVGSTISFVPWKNKDVTSKEKAKRNLAGLEELISFEAKNGKAKVLVVGPQAITGNPSQKVSPLVTCPPGGALAHFNGIRGVDAYKDFDTVIVVGRNQPAINELENLARALWYDSETPLLFSKDFHFEWRPYKNRDPSRAKEVEVRVHPDSRIQRLHEQLREGESTQAIDRLRLIHSPRPKRVIIVSNIPLNIEVDELVDLQTLLYRSRLDRAWEQLDGVLPLNPAWLSERFPDLWPTSAAARTDLRAGIKNGQIVNSIYIKSLTTLKYEYRVAGQKRQSGALSNLPLPETLDELSRLLGAPVTLFVPSGSSPEIEHKASIVKGAFEPLQVQVRSTA